MGGFSLMQFDALGTIIGFRFKGHNRSRSTIGGFLTLFIVAVIIVTFSFFASIYFNGDEVSQFNTIMKYWDSQNISLKDDFQIAVFTKYNNTIDVRDDIWQINFFYVESSISNKSFKETPIGIEPCKIEKWLKVESQFNFLKLDKALCMNSSDFELKGNYNTDILKYIKITYTIVVDLNSDKEVTKYKQIVADLSPVTSLFFMEGAYIVSGKQSMPTYFINSININVTWGNTKDIETFISQDEVQVSQDKVIYTDNEEISQLVISSSNEKISVRPDKKLNSLSYRIMSSNKKNVLKIRFMTISEMLARIGGIVQNLLTLIIVFNYFRSYWSFELTHINKILDKMTYDHLLRDINTKRIVGLEKQDYNTVSDSPIRSHKVSERTSIAHKRRSREIDECFILMENEINPLKLSVNHQVILAISNIVENRVVKKMKFGLCKYLYFKYFSDSCPSCCTSRKTDSYLIYNFANDYLSKSIEVDNSEKVFSQFQVLKYLAMTPYELKLFENLPISHVDQVINKIDGLSDSREFELFPEMSLETLTTQTSFSRKLTGLFYV